MKLQTFTVPLIMAVVLTLLVPLTGHAAEKKWE